MSSTEKHIVDLLTQQNEHAITLIYDQYAANLYGVIISIVKDEPAAQDVLKESFVKFWKYANKYDANKAKLFTWLLSISRNAAIDKLRSIKSKSEREIHTGQFNVNTYVGTNIHIESLDLRKHIDDLDDKNSAVIQAIYYQGYTQQQASENLNLPLGTIKTRIGDGLKALHKIYAHKSLVLPFISISSL